MPAGGSCDELRRQLSEARRRAESLSRVIEAISGELELRPLLSRVVASAVELLGAGYGSIGLVGEGRDGPIVRIEAAHNMPPRELGAVIAPGEGLAGRVLLEQRPVRVGRYGDLERPPLPELAEHAVIGLPVWWGGRMIGFFGIGAEPPRVFTEQDEEDLALFARHAAIAIENSRLFESERRRTSRIYTINRIGRLITSHLGLDQILQTAVEAIREHLPYSDIAVLLVSPDDPRTLVLSARSGKYARAVTGEYRQSLDVGVIGSSARARERVWIPDVRRDPRYIPIRGPAGERVEAELAVPITFGDELLGVLNVESERQIASDDADGLAIIADQLGVAIHNAHEFSRTERALEDLWLLYETSQRVSAARDVDDVISAYLQQVGARGQYTCSVALYELDEQGRRKAISARWCWTPTDGLVQLEERHPYAHDLLDLPLDSGETVTMADVRSDPRVPEELRATQVREAREALAMIPLMARGERIGLVVLSAPGPHLWSLAELRPYQATAAQLATAIDSRRQQQLLYERAQQIAILEERQRLARDLHDSVSQLLFSTALVAQSLEPAWRHDAEEGARRTQRLLELSQEALAEMRALLVELHPRGGEHDGGASPLAAIARLKQQGLLAALDHCASMAEREGIRTDLHADGYSAQSPEREEALYWIAQEAINNVIKHSGARSVCIHLREDARSVLLTVRDDGEGFDTPRGRHGGYGLEGMKARCEAVGGELRIVSGPHGTCVDATLPKESGGAS